MNRQEFIESCRGLSEEELLTIALESRRRADGRISEETQRQFRSLDEETSVLEQFVNTSYGKTHLYVVRPALKNMCQSPQEKQDAEALPAVVNVHGGGWSLDHTERDIYFSRRLAHRLNCLVLDVDYVLAPEYPYPGALEELDALFVSLPELIYSYGGDAMRIVLCGQSAGGNLVAAVMQRRRFPALPGIRGQVLCYLPTDNYNDHFHGGELDERALSTEYYGFFYNRNFLERKNHDVSILFADDEELAELPPTDIITAGKDPLCAEGKAYEERLYKAGVPTNYHCFEYSRHGFLVNLYDEWQEGEDYVVERIKHYFYNIPEVRS